jgi:hypothetical protein
VFAVGFSGMTEAISRNVHRPCESTNQSTIFVPWLYHAIVNRCSPLSCSITCAVQNVAWGTTTSPMNTALSPSGVLAQSYSPSWLMSMT